MDGIALVTGNSGKAREYAGLLGVEVTRISLDLAEIQSLDVAEVVRQKAADAYAQVGRPVLVDDTGLAIRGWNGLPGALVRWFLQAVGPTGVLAMAAGLTDRRATATVALGYADAAGVQVFTGALDGVLTTAPRGSGGFGYDCVFQPDGSKLTLAEMSDEVKNGISHRRLAVDSMRKALGIASH
ncbi:RdgB/HAM1 family non-canonical purine NTP pyrophosphatase [Kibdelosporangium lantanae]